MDNIPISKIQDVYSIVRSALAAFQLGALFTWGLHGILCVQTYNYYLSFPNDPISRKLLVYSVLSLETVQLALVTRDTYKIFTLGFGNILIINDLQLLPLTIPILSGIIGLICHLIFAYRITLISKSKIIGAMIIALALCSSTASFLFGGRLFVTKTIFNAISNSSIIYLACGLWNGFGAACDVLIAVCMTYYLSRTPTGFRKTDLFITRIIRLTIETGIVTASSSIASVTLFVGYRSHAEKSIFFIIPAVILAKMYSITILATFNNRPHAVGGPPTIPDMDNTYDPEGKGPASTREICIGRTVVQQVWADDDIPMTSIEVEMLKAASATSSIKDVKAVSDSCQSRWSESVAHSIDDSSQFK